MGHCAKAGRSLHGFVMSRMAAGEAEILSIAVSRPRRARGLARRMLDLHLRRLAGLGVTVVFLEVEANNIPALHLYKRAGFREVGRREGYYAQGGEAATPALVLRRDLT
jgi:ribosomal-protein-alanine N-acetyltransferase